MIFIETPTFTKHALGLLPDDSYRNLQNMLVKNPMAGDIVEDGLRKIRWSIPGHGKRGGVRIIYHWAKTKDQILMLFIYPKNEQDDLTHSQVKILRQYIEREYP